MDDPIRCGSGAAGTAVRGEGVMTNIPTELLRTLVAVVDLRSFTKAAQSLGVTQPAVSAQIKRLQRLLGADLLDKSAPGVSADVAGELVVNYARRLLSINDQILDIAGPRPAAKTVRIGATGDFTASGIALGLTCSRVRRPELRFDVYSANIDVLLRDLRHGDSDLAISVSSTGPTHRHPALLDRAAGLGACGRPARSDGRCRWFVSARKACHAQRDRRSSQAGRNARWSSSARAPAWRSGARVGYGAAAGHAHSGIDWDDAPLPKLPDIFCGTGCRAGVISKRRELHRRTCRARRTCGGYGVDRRCRGAGRHAGIAVWEDARCRSAGHLLRHLRARRR